MSSTINPMDFVGCYINIFSRFCYSNYSQEEKFRWLARNGFDRPSEEEIRNSWGAAINNYSVRISRIEYTTGYPEHMIYCSIYSINNRGVEIWIINLPERDFTEDNPAFIKSNPLFSTKHKYSINKNLLLEVAMKYYRNFYDCKTHSDCPVCFESIPSDEIYVTSCKHIFCKKCITTISGKPSPFQCPICRNNICNDLIIALKNISATGLYEIYCDVISTKESKQQYITENMQDVIGYILTSDDRRLLDYLLYESEDKEFKHLYQDYIVEGKKDLIVKPCKCFIREFTYALLYQKYSYNLS